VPHKMLCNKEQLKDKEIIKASSDNKVLKKIKHYM